MFERHLLPARDIMVSKTPNTPPSVPTDSYAAMADWSRAVAEMLLRVQQLQMEALATWQQTMSSFHQELWDEWVAHWGGGVPIEP
jgi:hypothetical protein